MKEKIKIVVKNCHEGWVVCKIEGARTVEVPNEKTVTMDTLLKDSDVDKLIRGTDLHVICVNRNVSVTA